MSKIYFGLQQLWFPMYLFVTLLGLTWLLRRRTANVGGNWDRQGRRRIGRLMYVPASCLPYHSSGYTTRTDAVIRALMAIGLDVKVHTRPGYPWDRTDRLAEPESVSTETNGVVYRHAREPSNFRPLLRFAKQGSAVIAAEARKEGVEVIHAASNHWNALPALFAARKLGIPFFYEMRGLWELSRASRKPWFKNSGEYRLGLALEGFVAFHADRVFVISEQLRQYAHTHWGIPLERMALLPNCVTPEHFVPVSQDAVESDTIVYAGSLIAYEGLDTLLEAVSLIVRRGGSLKKVRIVGHGEVKADLEALSERLGLSSVVQFHGRVAQDVARRLVAQATLVCIPRKPFQVCEIIPPIKMIEAMAMAKPVIVPDLPVFRDELGPDPAGWFFKAGDALSLADVIEAALQDRAQLAMYGAKAREYAVNNRSWHAHVSGVSAAMGLGEFCS